LLFSCHNKNYLYHLRKVDSIICSRVHSLRTFMLIAKERVEDRADTTKATNGSVSQFSSPFG
jgi:hypothetical protein